MIRLGINICLLGERVHYDGGHKLDPFLTHILGWHVEWVPVRPEVEMGLPTPREPIQLECDAEDPRLVSIKTRADLTERIKACARARVEELAKVGLHGFVFNRDSP